MTDAHPLRGHFAVIGYGSLIWDLDILAPHVQGEWALSGGPHMPMEFSRVSAKRKKGLVVVLDAEHGEPCVTHAIASRRTGIDAVATDLEERERAYSSAYIGAVCLETEFSRSSDPAVTDVVRAWCHRVGARGAVWTDLPRNFELKVEKPFSVDAAYDYLRAMPTLPNACLDEAVRYIHNAPAETDTPLRRRLANDACGLARFGA